MDRGTDGFAIAALVLGIIGFLGIIFGVIALNRIARNDKRGRGLAIAGIALGSVWVVLIAIRVILINEPITRSPFGQVTSKARVPLDELRVGDCITELPTGVTVSIPVGPCSDPHAGEVYDLSDLPDGPYPGDVDVRRFAEGQCQEALPEYVRAPPGETGYGIVFLHPSERSWTLGDHSVVCIANDPSGTPLTGSIRNEGPLGG